MAGLTSPFEDLLRRLRLQSPLIFSFLHYFIFGFLPPPHFSMQYLRDSLLLFLTTSTLSASLFLLYASRTLRPQQYLAQICSLIAASTVTCCCLFLFIITFHFKAAKFREWVERRGEMKVPGNKKRCSPLVKGRGSAKMSRRRRRVTPPPNARVSSSAPSPVLSSSSSLPHHVPVPFLTSPLPTPMTHLSSSYSSPPSIDSYPETFSTTPIPSPELLAASPAPSSPISFPENYSPSPSTTPSPFTYDPTMDQSPSPSPPLSSHSSPLSSHSSPLSSHSSPQSSHSSPHSSSPLSSKSQPSPPLLSFSSEGKTLSSSGSPSVPKSVLNNVVKALSASGSGEPEGFMSRRYRSGTHAKFEKMNMFPDFGGPPAPVLIQRADKL